MYFAFSYNDIMPLNTGYVKSVFVIQQRKTKWGNTAKRGRETRGNSAKREKRRGRRVYEDRDFPAMKEGRLGPHDKTPIEKENDCHVREGETGRDNEIIFSFLSRILVIFIGRHFPPGR